MTATVLVLVEVLDSHLHLLEAQGLTLIRAQTPASRAQVVAEQGERFDVVLTRGPLGVTAAEMDAMPNLRLICVSGAGYEQVDLTAARKRGIAVTNGAGVNAGCVADHAMALLLAMVRDIALGDRLLREGGWHKAMRPSPSGKRLGILGLGAVGMEIARRGELGFGMTVSYHNRRPKAGVSYAYCSSVVELARNSDFLVLATPGGAGTQALVDAEVLSALGPEGFLVNIARASVVDSAALLQALQGNTIAGAALDVFDDEPHVPDSFKALDNLVMSAHVAGQAPDTLEAIVRLVGRNIEAYLAGEPLLTEIPL